MSQLIDGKLLAAKIKADIKEKIARYPDKPGLAVVLVGEDPASKVYVGAKEKDCLEIGYFSEVHRIGAEVSEEELIAFIKKLNARKEIHGILVQLPLPKHLNEVKVVNTIHHLKDVDGFTFVNAGKLLSGAPGLVACTPKGCIEMIKSTGIDMKGKDAVVIGRSNIVGKPMGLLLMQEHCTVTTCHSRTVNIAEITSKADILVAAIGKAKFVTADMVKPGAVVIDVGTSKLENGKLCGDVDFDAVKEIASYITPVPGGVGPMTRAMLMKNTYDAFLIQKENELLY
jgi:methylenetetrahydrofolate dehydrogenase (NADP+) / methenyltetrahydrofolate cyclohydrolase